MGEYIHFFFLTIFFKLLVIFKTPFKNINQNCFKVIYLFSFVYFVQIIYVKYRKYKEYI